MPPVVKLQFTLNCLGHWKRVRDSHEDAEGCWRMLRNFLELWKWKDGAILRPLHWIGLKDAGGWFSFGLPPPVTPSIEEMGRARFRCGGPVRGRLSRMLAGRGLILGGRWGRRWREEFFRELNESKTCCDDDSLKRANQATEFLFPSFFFRPLFIHSFSILVFVIRLHSFFLWLSSFFSPLLPFSLSFYFWFFFDGISFDCGAGCGGGGGGGFYNGRARHCPILFNYPIQWLHFIMTFNYSALSFLALPPSTSLLSFLSK